jgi:hypothetical protein
LFKSLETQNKFNTTLSPAFTLDMVNKNYYGCDGYCDESQMAMYLVFNTGLGKFTYLVQALLKCLLVAVFQKKDYLTTSRSLLFITN